MKKFTLLRNAYLLAKADVQLLGGEIRDYWTLSLNREIRFTNTLKK